jgi:signal transduction histidine kinase
LAALSLQLEAFGTVVESEPGTSPRVREQLERTHRLVHEGLEEARGRYGALRDDTRPLDDQLERLCANQNARFTSSGSARALPPPVVVGLYRVAREALTNVMKHATGAPTSLHLSYEPDRVRLTVENAGAAGSAALRHSGGGYGIQGIAERLALLGGEVEAGPVPDGWRVSATVPLGAAAVARESSGTR